MHLKFIFLLFQLPDLLFHINPLFYCQKQINFIGKLIINHGGTFLQKKSIKAPTI
jgi:hypothetical protein